MRKPQLADLKRRAFGGEPVTIDDPTTLARELLMTDDVVLDHGQAPHTIATAQAWATLAVAEAVKRLAAAVEALHESGLGHREVSPFSGCAGR